VCRVCACFAFLYLFTLSIEQAREHCINATSLPSCSSLCVQRCELTRASEAFSSLTSPLPALPDLPILLFQISARYGHEAHMDVYAKDPSSVHFSIASFPPTLQTQSSRSRRISHTLSTLLLSHHNIRSSLRINSHAYCLVFAHKPLKNYFLVSQVSSL